METVAATMQSSHFYRAHGLTVRSDIELPELVRTQSDRQPDLAIRSLPARPVTVAMRERRTDFFPVGNGLGFHLPETGDILVPNGSVIDVHSVPDCNSDMQSLFVLGTAMGLALIQRGALVLHAASILQDGQAKLFMGDSGAGKSTLAARYAAAGVPVLGDDTVALWPTEEGFRVWPAVGAFKLWRDAADRLGIQASALRQIAARADKFYVPNPSRAEDRGWPVGSMVALDPKGQRKEGPLSKLAAIDALWSNLYRGGAVDALSRRDSVFRMVVSLTAESPVHVMGREAAAAHLPHLS